MANMRTPAIAGAALFALGWAGAAKADLINLGTASPLSLTGVPGVTTLTFSTPGGGGVDTASWEVSDPDFSSLFSPQDPTDVGAGIAALFNLSAAPTFDMNTITNPVAGTAYAPTSGTFNFAAIHQGQDEIVLAWATGQTSLTLGGFDGSLSNINFYSGAVPVPIQTSTVPELSTWAMLLLGFAGLGLAGYGGRRAAISLV